MSGVGTTIRTNTQSTPSADSTIVFAQSNLKIGDTSPVTITFRRSGERFHQRDRPRQRTLTAVSSVFTDGGYLDGDFYPVCRHQ